MPETIRDNYEVSSSGAVRHWEIPFASLEDVTPTVSFPAAVNSLLPGTQLTGTILVVDAADSMAVIDFTCSMVYLHTVKNVLTYAANVEATWGPINIGDPVYYDGSATMIAGEYLSTSPLDNLGVANPLFGHVVPAPAGWDTDAATFPHGAALVASSHDLAVMQIGAGG
jgi:hypothetical protein